MSTWIRAGRDHLWHRVSELEYGDAIDRGEYRLLCGERLPTSEGWQDAVPELVPLDDQHGPCAERAGRETYWSGRILPGELVGQVLGLVAEADTALEGVTILPRQGSRLLIFELRAANLDQVLAGVGRSPAAAVGELLATLEARR
jgi:hypothetical protein